MQTFTMPFPTRVQYDGYDEVVNTPWFEAYWGATITGEYLYNPYRIRITSISYKCRWKFVKAKPTPAIYILHHPTRVQFILSSRPINAVNSIYDKHTFYFNLTQLNGPYTIYPDVGDQFDYVSSWSGSVEINLPNEGGYLRGYSLERNSTSSSYKDHGQISARPSFPSWDPNNPGVQYWNGSSWTTHNIKRWDGSAWQDIPGRRWDGSSWQEVQG